MLPLTLLLALAPCLGAAACGGIAVLPADDEAGDPSGPRGGVGATQPSGASSGGPNVGSGAGAGGRDAGAGGRGAGGGAGTGAGPGSGGADCVTEPCVVADGFLGADLERYGDRLFVTTGEDSTLLGVPKTGGAIDLIAESDGYAGSLAVGDDALFWAGEHGLFRVPPSGGESTLLATPGIPLGAITLGGGDLYFVDRQAFGSIRAVPAGGGDVRTVIAYASLANDVAFVPGIKNWDTLLWVSTDSGPGELHALVLDGAGVPTTMLGSMDTPGAILPRPEGTYVTEPFAGTVSRVTPTGIGEFLVGTVELPLGLAVDDTFLYVSEAGELDAPTGRILRMGRFEATGIEVIAQGLHRPSAIVADEEGIYWLEDDRTRSVMRLAK